MSNDANYAVVEDTPKRFVIKDLGPWDAYPTITNDAEGVVKRVYPMLEGRRLFYYDSEGNLGEIIVDQDFGRFLGFG